jgi:NAD(P)H-hydrate epimerase
MNKINPKFLRPLIKRREEESHKGDYGHLLLVGGSQSMPGAAVLATGAALKSGCGLVTLHSTARAEQAAISSFPSAMLSEDGGECFSRVPDGLLRFTAIALGPGLGRTPQTEEAFANLLTRVKEQEDSIPMVLDADALFILAAHPELKKMIPAGSIMTPHEGELRRLISWNSQEEKELAIKTLCVETGCVVVSKGHLTEIYTPDGGKYVNTTGNAGLAKGGSGDVLTGLVGGLLARGYSALEAAALGVWIHGRAADALTAKYTAEAYSSRDLIDALYVGFKALE